MQNYFIIETEVAHRRFEWERTVASVEQRALAHRSNERERWSRLPLLDLARLRALAVLEGPTSSKTTVLEERGRILEVGRATGTSATESACAPVYMGR